jgi:hypothetical protein
LKIIYEIDVLKFYILFKFNNFLLNYLNDLILNNNNNNNIEKEKNLKNYNEKIKLTLFFKSFKEKNYENVLNYLKNEFDLFWFSNLQIISFINGDLFSINLIIHILEHLENFHFIFIDLWNSFFSNFINFNLYLFLNFIFKKKKR